MPFLLGLPIASVIAVLALRTWLLHRPSPRAHQEPFDGTVVAVGKAAVAERGPSEPRVTVVAMHGFLEDPRYFTDYYAAPDIQLIAIASCDYHVPFGDGAPKPASWAKTPSASEGSIRYDAEVLLQALEHLPRSERIRVHGHSRGGAVVLEAASLRPDLFAKVEVVLEAPVLPGGKPYGEGISSFARWLLPIGIVAWKREPISQRNIKAYGSLEDPRKRALIEGLPFHPKHTAIMLANLEGIDAWMKANDSALYRNVRGVVLVPGEDKVLDAAAMRASAAKSDLKLIELPACSHFVIFDRPDALPAL
jgi:pimeloyl-ACP methyl ester carboxylesterase